MSNAIGPIVIVSFLALAILVGVLFSINEKANKNREYYQDLSKRVNYLNNAVIDLRKYLGTAIKGADIELLKNAMKESLADPWEPTMKLQNDQVKLLLNVLESKKDDSEKGA